ncbi:hypothetical protein [Bradyrhizobium sp. LHD-71]|uniref:hypothetical protein n=1 Tax=Bradyrhizobium sp. LHD-71 TaxID=3072141 RepID=UPI00280C8171|nr:hypothetical protein [Bradyrhizobium sp. LHD-71]MDQ8731842.1 hypothetical protein [Bradyrhizobium sp. LHD-71]
MRVHHYAIIALLAFTGPAAAQTAGGTSGPAGSGIGATPGTGPLIGAPSTPSPPSMGTTGSGLSSPGATSVPSISGVPNTSTPGSIGTGAAPSGLPGDSSNAPGFPGGVGNTRR